MTELYPKESQKLNIVTHLEELRRRVLICLGVLAVSSVFLFSHMAALMKVVKKPIEGILPNLVFLSPTEVFSTFIKVALLAGFIATFPVILFQLWAFVSGALTAGVRSRVFLWLIAAFGLFVLGIAFSYLAAIPFALQFLLSFGQDVAVPNISLEKYVSFFITFILMGGIIFEIPVMITLLADIGLLEVKLLQKNRHYALVVVLITSAVITPTQDVFNMLLFALPMYLLYEVGIVMSLAIARWKRKNNANTERI